MAKTGKAPQGVSKTTRKKPLDTSKAAAWLSGGSSSKKQAAPSSQTTAIDSAEASSKYRLRLSIDIGTTFTKAAYQFVGQDGSEASAIHLVMWHSQDYTTPSVMTYQNGKLRWGAEVETQLRDHALYEVNVIRQGKLALHNDEKVLEIREAVMALLKPEGKSAYKLFANYTAEIVIGAKERIARTVVGGAYDMQNIDIDLQLSVPEVWQPHSNIALTDAAEKLGAVSCGIVGEAMCVATTMLEKEINVTGPAKWLKVGDRILVLDLGGGTGDFVLIELKDPILNGPNFGMDIVHPSEGLLCGSIFINKQFEKYLVEEYFPHQSTTIQAQAGMLGFPNELEFVARASNALNEAKKQFPEHERYVVSVLGKHKYADTWSITLTKAQMKQFFDHVVRDIDEYVEDMMSNPKLSPNVKCFILSGGLGQNSYVVNHIREKWEPKGIRVIDPTEEHKGPVPRGALLRYGHEELKPMGKNWTLFVVRADSFDPKLHPDAVKDETLVKSDPVSKNLDVVEDRCHIILRCSESKAREVWSQRYPTIEENPIVLKSEVFWTTRRISDHEAAYEPHSRNLRPGLQKFHEVEYKIKDHSKQKWAIVDGDNGEQCYEMYSCVVAKVSKDNNKIQLGFKVITDDTQPFDEEGNSREVESVDSKTFWDPTDYTKIWDRDYSHVVQEGDTAIHAASQKQKSKLSTLGRSRRVAGPKKAANAMFLDSDAESEEEGDVEMKEEASSRASEKAPVAKTRQTTKKVMMDDEEDGDVVMEDDDEE